MDQVKAENVLVLNADSVNFELVTGKHAPTAALVSKYIFRGIIAKCHITFYFSRGTNLQKFVAICQSCNFDNNDAPTANFKLKPGLTATSQFLTIFIKYILIEFLELFEFEVRTAIWATAENQFFCKCPR